MPSGSVVISLFKDGPLLQLERRIKSPRMLLKTIGRIIEREGQEAFNLQRFGTIKWEPRYPNQHGNKLNIAGALMDLAKGASVKARRYEDRPAAMDTGLLRRSVKSRAVTQSGSVWSVEVGSNLPYANLQHGGGRSRIPITAAMRANYWTLKNKTKKQLDKATGQKKLDVAGKFWPLRRLRFLEDARVTVYDVQVNARPFIGVTDTAMKDIQAAIIADFMR